MRILFLSNIYPNPFEPHKGAFNRMMVRALAESHTMRVVAPVSWTIELAGRLRRISRFEMESLDGIPIDYPRFIFPPKIARSSYSQWMWWSIGTTLCRIADQFRPDAILSYWTFPDSAVALRLAEQRRIPAIAMVGGSDVLCLARRGRRRTLTLDVLHRADAVVPVSRHLADHLISEGIDTDKIHVVYRGVDETVFHPGDREASRQRLGVATNQKIVVAVGRLVPVKGFSTLIDACRNLVDADHRFACYVLGGGPCESSLRTQIARLDLTETVHLPGPQTPRQLADWYRAADVVVLPSFSEGVPNVLLEAMTCGRSFVASDVGGVPEIADECHDRLVAPGNARALSEAISAQIKRKVSTNPSSRQFVPSAWSESAAQISEIIQSCPSKSSLQTA